METITKHTTTGIEKLIRDISKKGYKVTFVVSHDGAETQISVQPLATGMGHTIKIHTEANWCDALKSIEMKLFY